MVSLLEIRTTCYHQGELDMRITQRMSFRNGIMSSAHRTNRNFFQPLAIQTFELAEKYQIDEKFVRIWLVEMANELLLSLKARKNGFEISYKQWPNNDFFDSPQNHYKLIDILPDGLDSLELDNHIPIGFVSS